MSFLISLVLLVLVLAVAFFLFTRVSGLLRFFIGLAVFCVVVAFLVPLRHQVSLPVANSQHSFPFRKGGFPLPQDFLLSLVR